MSDYTKAHHALTIEANLNDPSLTQAAFDLLRLHARAYGLTNIGRIYVSLKFEVSGQSYGVHIKELEARIESLWLADITKHEITPIVQSR